MPAPAKSVDQQVVWKNDEMLAFAVSLARHALALRDRGVFKFTTDIVPDSDRGDGQGIAGSVVELLKNAHVIEPVGVMFGQVWYQERIKSERPESKSRYVNVHQLCSRAAAEEFLRRNRVNFATKQLELTAV
jgi:hypothetical protein